MSEKLTLDAVRAAVAGADPRALNAAKLREQLGRGSLSTIQKHLEALRAEVEQQQKAAAQAAAGALPQPDQALLQAVWNQLATQLQLHFAQQLSAATAQRDASAGALATALEDREMLRAALENLELELEQRDAAQATAAAAAAQAAAQQLALEGQLREAHLRFETLQAGLDRAVAAAAQAQSELRDELARAHARNEQLVAELAKAKS